MKLKNYHIDKERYAKCIEVSKRVRWDIDNDIIRGREFDFSQKFLPDGILQNQSAADVDYFLELCNRSFTDDEVQRIKDCVLRGYRWQYIFSGVEHPRFQTLYHELTTEDQRQRVSAALATLT
jgi:hypothetical protein